MKIVSLLLSTKQISDFVTTTWFRPLCLFIYMYLFIFIYFMPKEKASDHGVQKAFRLFTPLDA